MCSNHGHSPWFFSIYTIPSNISRSNPSCLRIRSIRIRFRHFSPLLHYDHLYKTLIKISSFVILSVRLISSSIHLQHHISNVFELPFSYLAINSPSLSITLQTYVFNESFVIRYAIDQYNTQYEHSKMLVWNAESTYFLWYESIGETDVEKIRNNINEETSLLHHSLQPLIATNFVQQYTVLCIEFGRSKFR